MIAVRRFALPFVAMTLLAVAAQLWLGGYASGPHWSDEAAHYVNGLLVYDWLRDGAPWPPMAYARDYYIHFPKVSIGHWPPLFYFVEALAFFVLGHSPATVLVLEALCAGTLAALVTVTVGRSATPVIAWLAALTTLVSPIVLTSIQGVMVDVPVALLLFSAALSWAKFLETQSARWSIAFALFASAAILTKGNGYCLALLPAFSVLIGRDWRLLWNWKFWLPAPIVGALVLPWFLATYRMFDGFVYPWGVNFFFNAVMGYGQALPHDVGLIGLAVAALGAIRVVRDRGVGCSGYYGVTALALVISTLLFHFIVPADINSRYIMAIVPGIVILAVIGSEWLRSWWPARTGVAFTAAVLTAFVATEFHPVHKPSFHMDEVARYVLHSNCSQRFILIASTPNGEGAFIAAIADHDQQRQHYVVRGLKVLGSGDWVGDNYTPRFETGASAADWIERNGIECAVLDMSAESLQWKHNQQLAMWLNQKPSAWTEIKHFATEDVDIRVYRIAAPEDVNRSDIALLRELAPDKKLRLP